jgi:diacylglycerol kinase (ATP)
VDVGRLVGGDFPEGRYFGNGVGIGFDAVVGFEALKVPQITGFMSYLFAALKTIFLYFKAPLVEIEAEGLKVTQPSLMVSIMNGIRLGGGFYLAPQGKPDDGLFDLLIAHEVSRLRIFGLIPRFMKGTQAGHPAIRTARVSHVQVTALKGSTLPAHCDGETVCLAGQRLTMEIVPACLELVVGSE